MANTISNMDDVIDSRDVIERIEHLTEERENWAEEHPEADYMATEEGGELRALLALQDEAEGYCPDWTYGAQLIRDSYFKDYAQELAEDCGMLENCNQWPATCIDWERAARELKMDYTAVEFDGVTYWVR